MPTTQNGNVSLYYEQHGRGPDLILIAGFTASHEAWRSLIPYLTKDFRVTVFDNRGAGESSDKNIDYSIDLMADDTIAIMDHLQMEGASIIGHSMGGFILQSLAARYPTRLHKAIFLCSRLLDNPRYMLHNTINQVMLDNNIDEESVYKNQALFLFSSNYIGTTDRIQQFINYRKNHPQSQAGFNGQHHALMQFDKTELLNQIEGKVSCYAIYGDDDLIATPDTADFIQQKIPSVQTCILPNCGHLPQMETPKTLAQTVCELILKQDTQPST